METPSHITKVKLGILDTPVDERRALNRKRKPAKVSRQSQPKKTFRPRATPRFGIPRPFMKQEAAKVQNDSRTPVKTEHNVPIEIADDSDEEDGAEEPEEETPDGLRLIMCYDLGTTFSGVSWTESTSTQLDQIDVIRDWRDSSPPGSLDKVKTVISFPDLETTQGDTRWGYSVDSKRKQTLWFKLNFATEGDLREVVDDPLLKQAVGKDLCQIPAGMTVDDVLVKMYTFLDQHTKGHIARTRSLNPNRLPITSIITFPAEYGEAKKRRLKAIVQRAGISHKPDDKTIFLSEPEASASLVIYESMMKSLRSPKISKGTSIMTLDLGGGSFDIVSFSVENSDPPKVDQISPPQGGYCGSTSVVRAFLKWCYEIFGEAFQDIPHEERGPGSDFIREFESRMQGFRGDEEDGHFFEVSLPTLGERLRRFSSYTPTYPGNGPMYDNSEGRIMITMDVMKSFFEEMRGKVCQSINRQIVNVKKQTGKEIKILVLCGGFALCEYVCRLFRNFCDAELGRRVKVKIPARAWSCVATGGVLTALYPYILQQRRSRMHLAVEVHKKFDETRDDNSNTYHCELAGRRGTGYLSYLFRKFEILKKKKTIKTYFAMKQGQTCLSFDIDLWKSDEDMDVDEAEHINDPRMHIFAQVEGRYYPPHGLMQRHGRTREGRRGEPKQIIVFIDLYPVDERGMFKIVARVGKTVIEELDYDFVPESYR